MLCVFVLQTRPVNMATTDRHRAADDLTSVLRFAILQEDCADL